MGSAHAPVETVQNRFFALVSAWLVICCWYFVIIRFFCHPSLCRPEWPLMVFMFVWYNGFVTGIALMFHGCFAHASQDRVLVVPFVFLSFVSMVGMMFVRPHAHWCDYNTLPINQQIALEPEMQAVQNRMYLLSMLAWTSIGCCVVLVLALCRGAEEVCEIRYDEEEVVMIGLQDIDEKSSWDLDEDTEDGLLGLKKLE